MTSSPYFNLLDEPWLRTRWLDGRVSECSLKQVFAHAHQIRALAGEIATQDAAVFRLLEAILLGATANSLPRSEEDDIDLWADWYEQGSLPTDGIHTYLERFRDRFYLFHPSTPFMQVADLHTSSGKASGLSKLIAEVPAGHPYFTTRAREAVTQLSFAEAARWLVHTQQFDPAGIKTGAVGDERVKNGKGYSMGYPAWAGNLGLVLAHGKSLFETLLLNLPLPAAREGDAPIWERPQLTAAVDELHPMPTGPASAFTWPSRRVRLFPSQGRVVDVQISNGDRLAPQNLTQLEPMTAWRFSKNQSKAGEDVLMPVRHDSSKTIWQGLASFVAPVTEGPGRAKPAAALEWLARLRELDILERTFPIRLQVVGLEYGTQNAVIDALVDDSLSAHLVAFTDNRLRAVALDAVTRASRGVVALVNLSSNLAQAVGGESEPSRQSTFELGYSLLDQPYRSWVASLVEPDRAQEDLEEWGSRAYDILTQAGDQLVVDAGPDALIGRQVPRMGTEDTYLLDAALAKIWFRAALNKALVTAPESEKGSPQND